MRVLVACEESQRVTIAFREKGHEAFSCDIKDCSGGHPEWHIKGDVLKILNPYIMRGVGFGIWFRTEDLERHYIEKWDLIVAHPPCTYLTVAGAFNFYKGGQRNEERFKKQEEARAFFMKILNADCKRICIENPRAMKSAALPPYSQVIQPYDFGDDYSKQTCLWLKGLPYLFPQVIEYNSRSAAPSWVVKHSSSEVRSKTFNGIAKAMAQQWDFD